MVDRTPGSEDSVNVGMVYKAVDGGEEVTPYFLDSADGTVNFTPVGRSREGRMDSVTFLKTYKELGPVSSLAEEQKDAKDNPPVDEPGEVVVKRNA